MSATVIVIGQQVHAALMAERERLVPHSKRPGLEHCYESKPLCQWQSDVHYRGYRGAELVKSIYGWSVRSDSGMENFCLIYSSRAGQVDGTFEDAVRAAQEWVDENPGKRYVWHHA